MRDWEELDPESQGVFRYAITPRLRGPETFEDAMNVSFDAAWSRLHNTIGTQSDQAERGPESFDIELSAALLCWWPLKPKLSVDEESTRFGLRSALIATQRSRIGSARQFGNMTYADAFRSAQRGGARDVEQQLMDLLLGGSPDRIHQFLAQRG